MLRRDVFAPLPGEGGWSHVLLVDGNIGIGGDPLRLLARASALLTARGTVLVETAPDPHDWWCGTARPCTNGIPDDPVPWACVGVEALRAVAAAAGLRVVATSRSSARSFTELAPT